MIWDRSRSKGRWTTEGWGCHACPPARQTAVRETGWRVLRTGKNRWSINNLAACKQHGYSQVIKAQHAEQGPAKPSVHERAGGIRLPSESKSTFILSYCIGMCTSRRVGEDRKTLMDFKSIHITQVRIASEQKGTLGFLYIKLLQNTK